MDPLIIVRTLRVILVLMAIALAAFPLFVLLDLAEGGTGYGLCPGGVGECRNPYTAAPELMTILTVGLLTVLGGFRITTHLAKQAAQASGRPGG
jgi:hypothetical protein